MSLSDARALFHELVTHAPCDVLTHALERHMYGGIGGMRLCVRVLAPRRIFGKNTDYTMTAAAASQFANLLTAPGAEIHVVDDADAYATCGAGGRASAPLYLTFTAPRDAEHAHVVALDGTIYNIHGADLGTDRAILFEYRGICLDFDLVPESDDCHKAVFMTRWRRKPRQDMTSADWQVLVVAVAATAATVAAARARAEAGL